METSTVGTPEPPPAGSVGGLPGAAPQVSAADEVMRRVILEAFELEKKAVNDFVSSEEFRSDFQTIVDAEVLRRLKGRLKFAWGILSFLILVTGGIATFTGLRTIPRVNNVLDQAHIQLNAARTQLNELVRERERIEATTAVLQSTTDRLTSQTNSLALQSDGLATSLGGIRSDVRVLNRDVDNVGERLQRNAALEKRLSALAIQYEDTLAGLDRRVNAETESMRKALEQNMVQADARIENLLGLVRQEVTKIEGMLREKERFLARSTSDLLSLALNEDGKEVPLGGLTVKMQLTSNGLTCWTDSRTKPGPDWQKTANRWQRRLGSAKPGDFYHVYEPYVVHVVEGDGRRVHLFVGMVPPTAR